MKTGYAKRNICDGSQAFFTRNTNDVGQAREMFSMYYNK